MAKKAFLNIRGLMQVREMPIQPLKGHDLSVLPSIANAFLLLQDNEVVNFGSMQQLDERELNGYDLHDASERFIFPAFCDAHTHAVFAQYREAEFVDKLNGLSYQEIAAKGGGILSSARKVQETSEEGLFLQSMETVKHIIAGGTGSLEIKSGYGLTLENELKMLRVIRRIKKQVDIPIKATFLAAHAIPAEFQGQKELFMEALLNEWIPKVLEEKLADYIDVFCETGYFDVNDIAQIGKAIRGSALQLKAHVNQFSAFGGVQEAVRQEAVTVDHLEVMNEEDFEALASSKTLATLLPACSFYLGIPFAPARKLCQRGVPFAIASDFNPGSSPTHNLFLVWSLACLNMKLTPEEAFNAMTVNGAFAMGINASHGAIFRGYKGKFILTNKAPSFAYFPYAFGTNHVYQILN